MSTKSKALAEGGTPIYVTRFDGVRVPATDYRPVWLGSLADDVTLEGSAMNGVAHGAEAVRSIVTSARSMTTRSSTAPAPPTASTSRPAGTESNAAGATIAESAAPSRSRARRPPLACFVGRGGAGGRRGFGVGFAHARHAVGFNSVKPLRLNHADCTLAAKARRSFHHPATRLPFRVCSSVRVARRCGLAPASGAERDAIAGPTCFREGTGRGGPAAPPAPRPPPSGEGRNNGRAVACADPTPRSPRRH
jgi:hypothetical protein